MAEQLLRDADIKPTPDIIAAGLGKTNAVYLKFVGELKAFDVSLMDWRYYHDGKAWLTKGEYHWTTARGTAKVKPLFWLSIWTGFFKVSFSFNLATKNELLALPISEVARNIIEQAEVNGKTMKFISVIFDVDNINQFNDIFVIMNFRKKKI